MGNDRGNINKVKEYTSLEEFCSPGRAKTLVLPPCMPSASLDIFLEKMSSSMFDDPRRKRQRNRRDDAPSSYDNTDGEREVDSEGSGEDLLDENMVNDYKEMGVLDDYDQNLLDEREYAPIDFETRRAVEAELAERDRREGRRTGRLGAAQESDEEGESEDVGFREQRRRRKGYDETAEAEGVEEEEEEPFNLETFTVPLREWVAQEQTKNEIKRRFKSFLRNFRIKQGAPSIRIYEKLIDEMCSKNRQSLEVSYLHLSQTYPVLAIWLADLPKQMLSIFDETAREVVLEQFEYYWRIHNEIHVRITDLPIVDSLRDMRHSHLNALVKVSGVIVRRSGVSPQLKEVTYNCNRCGSVTPPVVFNGADEPRISKCSECQSNGPFTINSEQTIYRNYQRVILQESPGTVPAGRVPQSKAVILLADLIDTARPGEEVEVTGIYQHTFEPGANIKNGFPVFGTVIEANYIQRKSDAMVSREITAEDRIEIDRIKNSPNAIKRIIKSIAPSIYGNRHVKMAVALAMFGGREKNVNQKHRVRGDINVLVLGDPGTAKSQVLKYAEKTAPRCVYTTGKGASAVGLTAAVHKDPMTGEWVLEGGALVLADRGVCCIDEFDKMTDQDRTSIHEAMEQQSISISKAGIVTTLQARCAVIAAANPIGGRYDPSKTFAENVQLTDPILTRFDVLCVLRDEVDPVADERLATFVVNSHARSHPESYRENNADNNSNVMLGKKETAYTTPDEETDIEEIPQDILRKYILEARELRPVLTNIDQEKVAKLYAELRKESEMSNGIPIAVRHIESMMRMSEALARMRHSNAVSDSDIQESMRIMLQSFIAAQKHAVQKPLERQFMRYLQVNANSNRLLLEKLKELIQERLGVDTAIRGALVNHSNILDIDRIEIKLQDLMERAKRHGITDLSDFLRSDILGKANVEYDSQRKLFIKNL